MKAAKRIGLGFLICTGLMCLFGGFLDGLLMLLVSIVCTAGIGLIVWVPFWWVIGWTAQAAYSAIRGGYQEPGATSDAAGNSDGKPASTATFTSSNEWSLADFIQRAKQKGLPQDKVNKILQNAGWSLEEIEQARQRMQSSAAKA